MTSTVEKTRPNTMIHPNLEGTGMSPNKEPLTPRVQIKTFVSEAAAPLRSTKEPEVALQVKNLNLYYGKSQALHDINLNVPRGQVLAFIGPSGCGKSTLLRCFNRMNDLVDSCRVDGEIMVDGRNVYERGVNVAELRRRVGMVFQKPNPFPKTIYENVAYGLRLLGVKSRAHLDEVVERSLRQAALWDEVKDRLHTSGLSLSGGQQQRLVIARAIALEPEILLLDEPCSSLDPIATAKIEDLLDDLKQKYTIVIVTHNMQQAARVSDFTGFMFMGKLVEFSETKALFTHPANSQTLDYITGRFG
jgi:phosphate transport system ATP-binding protein